VAATRGRVDPSRRDQAAQLIRQRLARQQITHPGLATPGDLVRWMGAVQAQDYAGSLWAIGLRLPRLVEADVEKAIAGRTIVRTWPMRGTLHFVPAEDARWMLRLLTPRVIARSAGRYRQLGLDDADFARGRRILTRALAGGRRLTRHEAYAALQRGGMSPLGQRGIHVLGHLAQQGLICFGPRAGKQPTFVLLEEWVPAAREPPREEALARLATRYVQSHGPATAQDFAWWSGLPAKDARGALDAARSTLPPATPGRRGRSAALLPPWDEYVVAYRDRGAVFGEVARAGSPKPIGSPLVVIDGRVRGKWRRTLAATSVRVAFDFWDAVTPAERGAVRKAAERYARFLGRRLEVA
jgi:hypothetical protein